MTQGKSRHSWLKYCFSALGLTSIFQLMETFPFDSLRYIFLALLYDFNPLRFGEQIKSSSFLVGIPLQKNQAFLTDKQE
jgi:hypothetical protein